MVNSVLLPPQSPNCFSYSTLLLLLQYFEFEAGKWLDPMD